MHKIYISLLLLFTTAVLCAQESTGTVSVTGDEITVPEGSDVYILGGYEDRTSSRLFTGQASMGSLANGDTLYIGGDMVNTSPNQLNITDFGMIVLNGDTIQTITGSKPILFHNLVLDKDTSLVPYQVILVSDSLELISGYINVDSIVSGVNLQTTGRLYGENNNRRFFGDVGKVIAEDRIISGADNDDIAGLGIDVSAAGSLGETTIERQTAYQGGVADGGIQRFYKINPENKGEQLTNLEFEYYDAQLRGLDESGLAFWQSTNRGVVWKRQKYAINTALNLVSGQSLQLGNATDLFTTADSICDSGPQVTLSETEEIALCDGESVVLDAQNEGMFYLWSTGETSQTITAGLPGAYYVQVWDSNGCFGRDTVSLVIKPYPVVNFKQSFVCQGITSGFESLSTISEGTMTYKWDFGVANLKSDTSILESPEYDFATKGVYTVSLTVTSDFGCSVTKDSVYVVHPLPEPAFLSDSVCLENISTFTNTSTILANQGMINYAIASYRYDFGVVDRTDDFSTNQSPVFEYTKEGLYDVKLVTESNAGCKDSVTHKVEIFPIPVVDFSFTNKCLGEAISFQNLSSIAYGNLDYNWDFDDGTTSGDINASKIYDAYGSYEVILTVTSAANCERSITKTVNVFPIPNAKITTTDVCADNTIILINDSEIADASTLDYAWTFGDGTTSDQVVPTKNYLSPGSYEIILVITSTNGCIDSDTTVVDIFPVPVADFSVSNVCLGTASSFTNQTVISAGQVGYLWDFGDGNTSDFLNPQHTYETAGTYTVTLKATTFSGCEDTQSKTLEVFEVPVNVLPASIRECLDTYTLDAGNSGSTYLWSTGATTQTLEITTTGTYDVTITTNDGCSISSSSTVTFINTLSDQMPETYSACGEVVMDAGNKGSTFVWSTGASGQTLTVSASGTYSVEITGVNGCTHRDEAEVTVFDIITPDLGENIAICADEETTLDAGVTGGDYLWSTGATTKTITISEEGNYNVTLTTPDGCVASDAIFVEVNPLPVGVFSVKNVCLGSPAIIVNNSTIARGEMSYEVNSSDGQFFSAIPNEIDFSDAGDYEITIVINSDQGCDVTQTLALTVFDLPVQPFGAAVSTCGSSLTLDAGEGAIAYEWSNGSTDRLITISTSGDYAVLITAEGGCSSRFTTKASFDSEFDPNLPATAEGCDKVTLDALNAGSTYSWSTGATSRSIVVTSSGSYTVEVTDQNGCIADHTFEATVNLSPVIALGENETRCSADGAITLDAVLEGMSYKWSTGATTQEITVEQSGTYGVTVISPKGCSSSANKRVTFDPQPVALFETKPVCLGEATSFINRSTLSSGIATFAWNLGDGTTTTSRTPNHSYASAGTFEVSLQVTSDKGCVTGFTNIVEVFGIPELPFDPVMTTCDDEILLEIADKSLKVEWFDNSTNHTLTIDKGGRYGVTLTNDNGCTVSQAFEIKFQNQVVLDLGEDVFVCDNYILDAGNTESTFIWSTGAESQTIEVFESGVYSVVVTDANGCSRSDEIVVTLTNTPIISLDENIAICEGEVTLLDAGTGADSYLWSDGSVAQTLEVSTPGIYTMIKSLNGCEVSAQVEVIVNPLPVVDLGNETIACDEIFLDAGNTGSTYLWSDGSINQTLVTTTSGTYWVEITTPSGCTASDTITLEVVPSPVLVLNDFSLCSGESVLLDAMNPDNTYLWSTGDTTRTLEVTASGSYQVVVTNSLGCSIIASSEVLIYTKVEVKLGPDRNACIGNDIVLNAGFTDAIYSWNGPNGFQSTTQSISAIRSGVYSLKVELPSGCTGIDTINVFISKDTVSSRYTVSNEVFIGDTLYFINLSNPQTAKFDWIFGDGIISNAIDPTHIYLREGVFQTMLKSSTDVCFDTSSKIITVLDPSAGRAELGGEILEEELLKDEITSINVYPNPTADLVTISLEKSKSGPIAIRLISLSGEVLIKQYFEGAREMHLQYSLMNLPSGVYFIHMLTEGDKTIKRILKY